MSVLFSSTCRGLEPRPDQPAVGYEVRVRVAGGYHPETITAPAGVPLRFVFHRDESNGCSEQVVLPTLAKAATLNRGQDVTVGPTAPDPGRHPFTRGMGMLRGTPTITPAATFSARSMPRLAGEVPVPAEGHFEAPTTLGGSRR